MLIIKIILAIAIITTISFPSISQSSLPSLLLPLPKEQFAKNQEISFYIAAVSSKKASEELGLPIKDGIIIFLIITEGDTGKSLFCSSELEIMQAGKPIYGSITLYDKNSLKIQEICHTVKKTTYGYIFFPQKNIKNGGKLYLFYKGIPLGEIKEH